MSGGRGITKKGVQRGGSASAKGVAINSELAKVLGAFARNEQLVE